MKFKGILFDLDGVLVHTDKLHYRAWKKIADARGILFNEEINNLLRGISRMESLEIILRNYHGPALSQEEKEALAEEKNNYYKEELKSMTPDDVFDAVSDGTNITKSKPDPEVFLKAAEYIGLPPEECLVVEDAVAGIEAAKRGGMKAAGIGDAAFYEKTDYPMTTFADLKEIAL